MKISSLREAEQALQPYIPMVKQMTGKDITLERMVPLMERLGNPQDTLQVVHVAGTSGKTSTAYYVNALLTEAGQKTGLTVSPHIDSLTERLQINGHPVSEQVFAEGLGAVLELIGDMQPSYFELLMAFAYWYFALEQVDYAVIETGFGGLHDASNIAHRADKICVLTDIGFDHMHILGNTLPEIATQKAGIMHAGNHAFTFKQADEVMDVFTKEAAERGATLYIIDETEMRTQIPASAVWEALPIYQQHNWLLAYAAYRYVQARDHLPELESDQLAASMQTYIPGRMDIRHVAGKTVVMDGAHNGQKMTAFVHSFQAKFPDTTATILLALKADKEFQTVLPLLKPISDHVIITSFAATQDIPATALDAQTLANAAKDHGFTHVIVEPNYQKAYTMLMSDANPISVITGSFYLLALVRPLLEVS